MKMPNRTVLGRLAAISLALVATATLAFLNWGAIFKNLVEAWDTQAERAQVTLFRWGELMSIGSELKDQYGAAPDVTYDTSTRERSLNVCFSDYHLPERVTAASHAREIAAFAVGKTTKFKQIDVVRVQFQKGVEANGSASFTFALDDLMPSQPRAKS